MGIFIFGLGGVVCYFVWLFFIILLSEECGDCGGLFGDKGKENVVLLMLLD